MEAISSFYFRDREIDPIRIQCKTNDKFGFIFDKFANKYNIKSDDYEFYSLDKLLPRESTIKNYTNNKNFDINVKRKNKIMKCPECICNNCIIRMKNYKLNFSECRYGHEQTQIFNNYENSQRIDYTQIICHVNECKEPQSKSLEDFYKCMDCSKLNGNTTYFCQKHYEAHKKSEHHTLIKYDEKYYFCPEHFKKFLSYCTVCRTNLCDLCEKEHEKDHNIKRFDSINLDLETIKNDLKDIKSKTDNLKNIVNQIKNLIDGAVSIIEKYYTISLDLIRKYESFNKTLKNYQVIESIDYLTISNKEIIKDLKNIINGNKSKQDWVKKCKILIGIYKGDREFYVGEEDENENNETINVTEPFQNNGNNFIDSNAGNHCINNS